MNSNPSDKRLPLFATVRKAYALAFLNCGVLIGIAWAWLIVLTVLVAVASWFFWPSHAAALEAGDITSWVQTLTGGLSMIAGASVAVAWHRFLLKMEKPDTRRYLRLDGVVGRYLLFGLVIAAPFYLFAMAFPSSGKESEAEAWSMEVMIGSLMLLVLALVLGIKLSPILPAIAMGRGDVTFSAVWRATNRSWWLLLIGTVLTLFPPMLILSLPSIIKIWQGNDGARSESQMSFVLSNTQIEIATLVSSIFAITFLSLAFQHFFPEPTKAPPPSDAANDTG